MAAPLGGSFYSATQARSQQAGQYRTNIAPGYTSSPHYLLSLGLLDPPESNKPDTADHSLEQAAKCQDF